MRVPRDPAGRAESRRGSPRVAKGARSAPDPKNRAVACILETLLRQTACGTSRYTSQLVRILCGKPDLDGAPDSLSPQSTWDPLAPYRVD